MSPSVITAIMGLLVAPWVGAGGFSVPGDQLEATALAAWAGTWEGEMTNVTPAGASAPIPVALRIALLEDGSYEWRTVYNGDVVEGLRDYRLRPDATDSTRFVMDEQNGIRITSRLVGNALLAPFSVGGQFLLSRYTLVDDDHLEHEILFWPTEVSSITTGEGPAGEQGQPVASFEVAGIQRTRLRRVTW